MANVNLNNPIEIRAAGLKALEEVLGPVGMVRFMQQFEIGSGDYTKEKQEESDFTFEELDLLLKNRKN